MQPGDFIWLTDIVDKIKRKHQVEPYEVEEVFAGQPRIFRGPEGHYPGKCLLCVGLNRRRLLLVYRLRQEKGWTSLDPIGSRHDRQGKATFWKEMNTMTKLPKFETLDELVAFWDTHDFTEYLDEMEEVDLETGLPGHTLESLRIRLDKVLMQRLGEIAAEQGLSSSGLVRLWLEERLLQETGGNKR